MLIRRRKNFLVQLFLSSVSNLRYSLHYSHCPPFFNRCPQEIRVVIANNMKTTGAHWSPEEQAMYDSCYELKSNFEAEETRHQLLMSSSPFVKYSMHPARKNDERGRVATGKAVAGGVDTSVEDAAAWVFDVCSRNRMQTNVEVNESLPRTVVETSTDGVNSLVLGSLKSTPFPLSVREYIVRMMWLRLDSEKVAVLVKSVDMNVDFGVATRNGVVRGLTTAFQVLEAKGRNTCLTTLYQKLDLGGHVPVTLVNAKTISGALAAVGALRDAFQRDNEVDREDIQRTIEGLRNDAVNGNVSYDDAAVFNAVADAVRCDSGTERLQPVEGGSDHFVKLFQLSSSIRVESGGGRRAHVRRAYLVRSGGSFSNFIAKVLVDAGALHVDYKFVAKVLVDAGAVDCAAWQFMKCSRQRQKSFVANNGGAFRSEKIISSRRREFTDHYREQHNTRDVKETQYKSDALWRKHDDGSNFAVIETPKELENTKIKKSFKMVTEIALDTTAGDLGGISQTKAVMKLTFSGRNIVGSGLSLKELAIAATRHMSEMRKYFDKSPETEKRRREAFCKSVRENKEEYSASEEKAITWGNEMFARFDGKRAKTSAFESLKTKVKVAFVKVDSRRLGWASTLIRASAIEVLAYLTDHSARYNCREDDLERSVDEAPNRHNQLVYVKKRTLAIIANRDFLGRVVWKATSVGFDLVSTPEVAVFKGRPHLPGVVRGTYPSAIKITTIGNSEAEIEYAIDPNFGGDIPLWVMNFYIDSNLSYVTEIQYYFQGLRQFSEYDEKDGAAVGEMFMIKTKEEVKKRKVQLHEYHVRVAHVVNTHVALTMFSADNPWFPSLVEGMLSNWLREPIVIKTKLDNLSHKEAFTIGRSFAFTLFDRQTANAAVDMFINEYVSLVELRKRQRFFEAMALTIGQRKLEKAPWGRVFKVGLGAVLGLLDVGTDIYAIASFTMREEYGFARAVIAMISVSMAIQVFLVVLNGKKRGVKHLLEQTLLVLSGMKPAVDAFRVISGVKAHVDDTIAEPMLELFLSKSIEMVAESIPSALVQLYAVLSRSGNAGKKVSPASIISIIVSLATISLATTTSSFDMDLAPDKRTHTPDFYGYIPSNGGQRTVLFASMFLFTACHVGIRLLGIALLAVVDPGITAAILGGDMLFFMLFKLARDDFRYWIHFDGMLSWVMSFVVRLFTKLMVDFTVMVQLRRTYE